MAPWQRGLTSMTTQANSGGSITGRRTPVSSCRPHPVRHGLYYECSGTGWDQVAPGLTTSPQAIPMPKLGDRNNCDDIVAAMCHHGAVAAAEVGRLSRHLARKY